MKTILLILGSTFSGSTIVGQALNQFANIAYAGELDRLHQFGFAMHAAANHYVSHCEVCISCDPYSCPIFPLIPDPMVGAPPLQASAYLDVATRFGVNTVVDGSKNVDWLHELVRCGVMETRELKVLILVRNVCAFTASQKRAGFSSPILSAEGWRNIYRHALRSVASFSLPFLIVRHEDFVASSAESLVRIMKFATGEEQRKDEAKALHALGGNLSAYSHRREFDKSNYIAKLSEDEARVAREKFSYFGGEGLRADPSRRWANQLTQAELTQILDAPGVFDTMLDLGYPAWWIREAFENVR